MDLLGIAKLKVEERGGVFYDVSHAPSRAKIMSNQRRTASLNGESLDVIHVRVLVKSEPVDLHIGVRLDVIHVRVLVKSEPVDLHIGVRSRGGIAL